MLWFPFRVAPIDYSAVATHAVASAWVCLRLAMACSTWLHYSPFSLLPVICRHKFLLPSNPRHCRRPIPTGRFISTQNQFKYLPLEVQAQAKRGLSFKEDQAALRKQTLTTHLLKHFRRFPCVFYTCIL